MKDKYMQNDIDEFFKLYEKSFNVAASLRAIGRNRAWFYDLRHSNEAFRTRFDYANQDCNDFVESKLLENINSNDTNSIKFYLQNKHDDYKGEKKGEDGIALPNQITINIIKNTDIEE